MMHIGKDLNTVCKLRLIPLRTVIFEYVCNGILLDFPNGSSHEAIEPKNKFVFLWECSGVNPAGVSSRVLKEFKITCHQVETAQL